MTEKQAQQFQDGLIAWLKNVAVLIAAVGVVVTAFIQIVKPNFEDWLEDRDAPILERVTAMEASISNLSTQLLGQKIAVLEFIGAGQIADKGPHAPGSSIEIVYQLRRNLPCATTVQARFVNGLTGRVDTSLTYEYPATRAPVSREYSVFTVRVNIPESMPAGSWSYSPILVPKDCNGVESVQVPISQFFLVGS